MNSLHKSQWRKAFSLICVWINVWVNTREAGALERYRARYDVTVVPRATDVKMNRRVVLSPTALTGHPTEVVVCLSLWYVYKVCQVQTILRGYPAKRPYLPWVSMAGRALLAGYHRLGKHIATGFLCDLPNEIMLEVRNVFVFFAFTTYWIFSDGVRHVMAAGIYHQVVYHLQINHSNFQWIKYMQIKPE